MVRTLSPVHELFGHQELYPRWTACIPWNGRLRSDRTIKIRIDHTSATCSDDWPSQRMFYLYQVLGTIAIDWSQNDAHICIHDTAVGQTFIEVQVHSLR